MLPDTMKSLITLISFPSVCATLGGAEYVKLGLRFAKVKLPGRPEEIRLKRSALRANARDITSFNAADAALAVVKS